MIIGQLNIDDKLVNDVVDWYKHHSLTSTSKKFGISRYYVQRILDALSIEQHASSDSIRLGARETRLNNINEDEFKQYYSTHTETELAMRFNISMKLVKVLMEDFGIDKRPHSESIKMGVMSRYGVENVGLAESVQEKMRKTCIDRYGVPYYMQTDEFKETTANTCMERYGVSRPCDIPAAWEKSQESLNSKYGDGRPGIMSKIRNTCLDRYGVESPLQSQMFKDKMVDTCMERYGVPYNCMTPNASRYSNKNSCANEKFASLLNKCGIQYSREKSVGMYSFDFLVDNLLIEINPTVTHNSDWSPFGDHTGKDKYYHQNKTLCAIKNNYLCLNLWDWDSKDTLKNIISLIGSDISGAIKYCFVKQEDAITFFRKFSFYEGNVGNINVASVCGNSIIAIMTFSEVCDGDSGEYELVGVCNPHIRNHLYAYEMFSLFVNTYLPSSISCQCSLDKYTTDLHKLGFKQTELIEPKEHVCSIGENAKHMSVFDSGEMCFCWNQL